jgi:hypothetical protein
MHQFRQQLPIAHRGQSVPPNGSEFDFVEHGAICEFGQDGFG